MITIDRLNFSYPGQARESLRNLSLTIHDGESVCLMGANGCGKSTLAKLIAGLLIPSSGSLSVVTTEPEENHSLPIGLLFQDPDNQMVAAVVDKEIAFAPENLAMPALEMVRVINYELNCFQLEPLRKRLTTELSGGEKQRVALASVMVTNPHVLILDEPDSFLDQPGKRILQEELVRLHRERPALIEIRITQYPEVARSCSRLIVLANGGLVADGPPGKILDQASQHLDWGLSFSVDERQLVRMPTVAFPKARAEVREIALSRVGFAYSPDRPVLHDLDCCWRRGQTLGVVGPSGSGKSTFGQLLCGLATPTHGVVNFLGQDGERLDLRRKAGIVAGVFQQPERQFFLPTCGEEVKFGPSNLGVTLTDSQIDAFLLAVGLPPEAVRTRDPFTLSMGEKRRLAFAAILSMSPQFVVFDEPTCALDREGVSRFVLLSQALKKQGVGQVIISHDPEVIALLSDSVLYFRGDGSAVEMSPEQWFGDSQYRPVMPSPPLIHII